MSKTNNGFKWLLKKIRAFTPVNVAIRLIIRSVTSLNSSPFRFFSTHWPVSGVIKLQLPHGEKVKMYAHSDDYVATQVFWKGYKGYEGCSIEAFYYLSKKSSVIIDIGANTGYFTLVSAFSNPNSFIYSFEPVERIYNRLNRNVEINKLTNVTIVNSVAGDSENPVKFYLPKGDEMVMAGSTKKEWARLHDAFGVNNSLSANTVESLEIEVPSTTIDFYKKNKSISKIDLIKMDCESHEVAVLNGMQNILKEDKPIILMEVIFENDGLQGHVEMATHIEIERIMKTNGYYFYLIEEDGLKRVDKLEHIPDERNYIFSTRRSEKTHLSFSELDLLHE